VSFFENTRKPVGFGGQLMVAMMNVGHSAVARWGLQFLNTAPDAKVLDCGCGGGANIKTEKSKAACFKRPCRFVLYFAGSGSFPQPHSATLTGRTYTPSAV
jgi:hypothetical protein